MRKYLLLDKMTLVGYSKIDIANRLKISVYAFNARLNGKTEFRYNEICRLCKILKIEDDAEKEQIFLT